MLKEFPIFLTAVLQAFAGAVAATLLDLPVWVRLVAVIALFALSGWIIYEPLKASLNAVRDDALAKSAKAKVRRAKAERALARLRSGADKRR